MKTRFAFLTLSLALSAFAFGEPVTNKLTGNWLGTLDTGTAKLRLLFKVTQTYSGVLTAKLDSLDQGARDIPVSGITVKDDTVRLEVKAVKGAFEGKLDDGSRKITGAWEQSGQSLPLTLEKRDGAVDVAAPEKLTPAELAASKQAAQKLAGLWKGELEAGAATLQLNLRISRTAAGAAAGTIESVDQGVKDIPVTAISCKDGDVHFEARGIGAHYDGKLSPGGAMLTGKWYQSGRSLPLEFKKSAVAR